jgi:hypothetical protein
MRTPDDPKKFKLKGNDLITVVRDPEKQKRKDLAF